MYLNVYVPALQRGGGVASFFRFHLGYRFASSALMDPITQAFIAQMEQFAEQEKVPMVTFAKGQRKDDVAAEYRKKFSAPEGVFFIGKAQEKTSVFRTERRRNEQTGATYPWLVRSTAMVNHFYVYCIDRDFGPFFLKFCTYFPYNAKLCLNGHEYVKRQLTNRGIGYEALDNGILSCADPKRVQALCDGLSKSWSLGLLEQVGMIRFTIMKEPKCFVAVFGDPEPDRDPVDSGVYEAGEGYPSFLTEPGDMLLLYCTEGYAAYQMQVPGIGVVLEGKRNAIKYPAWSCFA
jgi:hypothetical protein